MQKQRGTTYKEEAVFNTESEEAYYTRRGTARRSGYRGRRGGRWPRWGISLVEDVDMTTDRRETNHKMNKHPTH